MCTRPGGQTSFRSRLKRGKTKVRFARRVVAAGDYNAGWMACKRPVGNSVAIEDMDWSWMSESYVCFTETFDADAELSNFCDDDDDYSYSYGGVPDELRPHVTADDDFWTGGRDQRQGAPRRATLKSRTPIACGGRAPLR